MGGCKNVPDIIHPSIPLIIRGFDLLCFVSNFHSNLQKNFFSSNGETIFIPLLNAFFIHKKIERNLSPHVIFLIF